MTTKMRPIDITNMPELERLADEVRANNQPLALQRNHETVAVLMPATRAAAQPPRGRKLSDADIQAFLSSAGSWKGIVDTERLKKDIYESREMSSCHSVVARCRYLLERVGNCARLATSFPMPTY